tara:strand:+ start:1125 stop:3260 length:2136 start_codon:yes stop_codon:yes gene_type:complete
MKIVTQNFKTGVLSLLDIPIPKMSDGEVLVRTHASLISLGTDRSVIALGKKNSLNKAISRPDLVKKVMNRVKKEGFWSTFKVVNNLISEPRPFGYSLVGTVIKVGKLVDDISVGDRVTCSGAGYANHSEVVSVPKNLCVKIPNTVSDENAVYSTLGTIAMHGIRQANQQIGSSVLIVGLGLVGQLSVQICKANGFNICGLDFDKRKIDLSIKNGANISCLPNDPDLKYKIDELTDGIGIDAVLLTAGSKESGEIFEQVAKLCRDRARIVVVGDVKMDINRSTFFEKELEIFQSRSYGPGRYDKNYEEKGNDYPVGYVRWTERRNTSSFLSLIDSGKINPSQLTTHKFSIKNAMRAYDLVTNDNKENIIGILIKYNSEKKLQSKITINKNFIPDKSKINLGIIGAGNFAKSILLPSIYNTKGFNFYATSSNKGISSKVIAEKYNASIAYDDPIKLINDKNINALVISTRHNTHAEYVTEALKLNKHVFVEKPLAINSVQLQNIRKVFKKTKGTLSVGYNRRYSDQIKDLKNYFSERTNPIAIMYRINAGFVSENSVSSWVHDKEIGGGRIIGEACHFIDVLQFLCDSNPISLDVTKMGNSKFNDTVSFTMSFEDGSIGTIHYWSNGSQLLPKERLEVFCQEKIGILDNFKNLQLINKEKIKNKKYYSSDKGFNNESTAFLKACKENINSIDAETLFANSEITFKIIEKLREI